MRSISCLVHGTPLSKLGNQDYLQPEESGVSKHSKHPSTNLSHGILLWPVNVQSRQSTQVEEGEEQHRHKEDDFQPAGKEVKELRGQNNEKQQDPHLLQRRILQPDSSQRRQPSNSTLCALKEQPACTQQQSWEGADGREAGGSYGSDDEGKVHIDNCLESHGNDAGGCDETKDNLTWSTNHCCTMMVLLNCCFGVNITFIQSTGVPHSHLGDQEPHREVRTGRQAHHHQCPPLHWQIGGYTAFPPSWMLVSSPSTALVEASAVFSVSLSIFNQNLETSAAYQGCTGSPHIQWPDLGVKNALQVGAEHLSSICHQLETLLGVGESGPAHNKQSLLVDLPQPAEKGVKTKESKPGEHQGTNLLYDELLQHGGGEEQGSQKQAAQVMRSSNKRKAVACRHASLDTGQIAVSAIVPDKRDKEYKQEDDITSLMINGKQSLTHQVWDESSSRENGMMSTDIPTTTVDHAASLFISSSTQPSYNSCIIWIRPRFFIS